MSEPSLPPNTRERVRATRLGFSTDWLAVFVALALVALVRTGVLGAVPW
jgi:hypothetical protein